MRRLLCWVVGHSFQPEVDHGPRRWSAETRFRVRCARCEYAGAWEPLFTESERRTLHLVDGERQ